jgi:hypothetical protein
LFRRGGGVGRGYSFTRQGRPKAASSAAFRQGRKTGAGFGRSTRGGFAPVKAAGQDVHVPPRRDSLKGTGILDGRATPLAEHADTLNEARERASFKARALGWPNYFELDTGENFRTRRRTAFMCWRSKRNSSRNRFKDIRSIMVAGTLGLLGHARPLTQE